MKDLKKNFIRYFKKIIYENMIFIFLFFYRWIICIAPSPISGLINSNILSRKMHIVPWGVSKHKKIPKFQIKNILSFNLFRQTKFSEIGFGFSI